jgi:basic membrane lipoprotein Med (substrate-binding protein (PBP1-ABC) superfamily)
MRQSFPVKTIFSFWTLLIAIGAIALCGCHRSAGARRGFSVALLVPGPISDAGWNAAAYDGLMLIHQRLDAHTAMVQTASPADFADAMRDFAARDFRLVFAHGFEYTDAAISTGRQFPHTIFAVTSGSASAANVASISFKIEEAAYVEGVIAGGVSKTGVVGAIGGIEIPSLKIAFDGFRRGFLSVRPDGRMLVSYTGNFNDVGAAKEAALAQISHRADVIFQDADAAGIGVFEAAAQAHAYAFGIVGNQNDVVPGAVLASAVTSIPQAFLRVATEVKNGTFRTGMIQYGMRDGMVSVVINPRLQSVIPATAIDQAKRAEQLIVDGSINLSH